MIAGCTWWSWICYGNRNFEMGFYSCKHGTSRLISDTLRWCWKWGLCIATLQRYTTILTYFIREATAACRCIDLVSVSRFSSYRSPSCYSAENYKVFYDTLKKAYPDIKLISNCDGSSVALPHPSDYYDFHVQILNLRNRCIIGYNICCHFSYRNWVVHIIFGSDLRWC